MTQGRMWTVLGVSEPGKPGRVVIWDTADVTVGRSPESDIMVDDSDASRQHAHFVRTAAGYTVEDRNTSNGTFVNDERIFEAHVLSNKDVVKICEMQIRFIETHKDPASLGLEVVYASNLKGFSGGTAPNADPSATTIGLVDSVSGPFQVGAVGDFDSAAPRDLDLELEGGGGTSPAAASGSDDVLSVVLEMKGVGPELRQTLQSLFGKVIELPAMRVRIKPDDEW